MTTDNLNTTNTQASDTTVTTASQQVEQVAVDALSQAFNLPSEQTVENAVAAATHKAMYQAVYYMGTAMVHLGTMFETKADAVAEVTTQNVVSHTHAIIQDVIKKL